MVARLVSTLILLGTAVAVLAGGPSSAQAEGSQLWLDYNPSWMISPKTTLGGDVGLRTQLDNQDGIRLVLRPGINLPVKTFTLRAGIGNFFTFSDDIQNRWELRPYQGVFWVWPRSKVNFDHYVRLEERFDFNTVDWSSENSLRGRYRLRLRFLFAQSKPGRFWRAQGAGEIFVKLAGEEGLQRDQYRITLALERSFSRSMRWRLEGIWRQADVSFIPDGDDSDFYLRIRFYQNF
jgi:hypothetical protein